MTRCAAIDCKNIGIHIFPKDPKRRKLWEQAVRRKNWKATNSSRLCADHFKQEDYYGKNLYTGDEPTNKVLKKTAVPSIFSFNKAKRINQLAKERQNRHENRSQKKLSFESCEISGSAENPGPSGTQILSKDDENIPVQNEIEIHNIPLENLTSESSKNTACALEVDSKSTQVNFEHIYGSIERFKDNDNAIAFYTGFESYEKFYFVFSTLSPMVHLIKYYGSKVQFISAENQFFLTMIKIRQNKCHYELALFFQISTTTVFNIFITWINYIHQLWTKLNIWPDKELVSYYMPETFKKYDKNTRVIIDGTEIKVQKPGNPTSQQASWSSYKHSNTLKILVGSTPGGLLSYCSPAYAGSVSDRQTVERSQLIKLCEPGDSILADRGYNIQDLFIGQNIKLNIPTFLKGKGQIPSLKLVTDRKLARQRVHIERLIGLTKTYKILKEELHHNFVPLASKIFFVCMMCCNFRECIM